MDTPDAADEQVPAPAEGPRPKSSPGHAEPDPLTGDVRRGRLVQQVVLASALWIVATAAVCVPLSAIGLWHPLLVAAVLPFAAWQCWLLAARVPAAPLNTVATTAMVVVALAATVWLGATHAEQVLPRRDAGSNLQAAISLAEQHRRVVPLDVTAFGGPAAFAVPAVTAASPAFYQVGSAARPSIQPQFVIGPAAVLSLGWWVGGAAGAFLVPALLTGLALLGLGLLVGRVTGPRWGPVAMLAAAVCFPVVHTGRSTLSEPLADLTVVAGLLALTAAASGTDATLGDFRSGATLGGFRTAGAVAGLLIGGTELLRADALRETVLLTVVGGLAAVQRRPWARPLLVWAGVGTAYGLIAALWLSPRYLGDIAGSLVPLLLMASLVGVAMAAFVRLSRRGFRLRRTVSRALPLVLGVGTVVAGLTLASRPLWQVVRQSAADPGSRYVAGLQLRQGLPVDGGRTYAEHTVAWLSWSVGWPALVISLATLAYLMEQLCQSWRAGRDLPGWGGPLLVAAGSTLFTLYRPGITPDHPWADRRVFIPLVLVIVLTVVAAARVLGLVCHRAGPWAGRAAGLLVVALLLVPAAVATWPHRAERVEQGSTAVVAAVCAALRPGDVVLAVDSRAANEWPQVVRGQCHRPALSTTNAARRGNRRGDLRGTVAALSARVTAAGGRLVLLAADSSDALDILGATPVRRVGAGSVLEDDRLLTRAPTRLLTLPMGVWLAPAAS